MPDDVSYSHIFHIRENFFQSFCTKFLSLLYMRSLAFNISHCLPANHNPELWRVICTGVTLFAPVLHFLHWCYTFCTALSQSESSNFHMCIISIQTRQRQRTVKAGRSQTETLAKKTKGMVESSCTNWVERNLNVYIQVYICIFRAGHYLNQVYMYM